MTVRSLFLHPSLLSPLTRLSHSPEHTWALRSQRMLLKSHTQQRWEVKALHLHLPQICFSSISFFLIPTFQKDEWPDCSRKARLAQQRCVKVNGGLEGRVDRNNPVRLLSWAWLWTCACTEESSLPPSPLFTEDVYQSPGHQWLKASSEASHHDKLNVLFAVPCKHTPVHTHEFNIENKRPGYSMKSTNVGWIN